jgi:integrase
MASTTVPKARPGQRVKIATRLYEVGNKDGTLSFFADVELDGRQRRIKLAARGRTEAREEQAKLTADKSRNLIVGPNKLTLDEVAQEWLDSLDVKPRSRDAYRERLQNILPQLGTRQVQSIKPRDITALQRWLRDERKLARATQTATLNVLRSILKHAVAEDYIASNPFDRFSPKHLKVTKVPHRYLSPAEVARLLDNSNGYRSFFEVLAFAGLRVSEAAGLVWSDIDLQEGAIHVRAQLARGSAERVSIKNEEERTVNIDPHLAGALRDHKEKALALGRHKPTDWVFQTGDGNPYDYRNLWGAFQTATKRAKLNGGEGRKLRIHDLRRTYASILLNDGQPAAFVAKQLGHTVDVLFRTYAGLIENQQGQHRERQLGAIAAFRSGAPV